jgi:hypothetical protein
MNLIIRKTCFTAVFIFPPYFCYPKDAVGISHDYGLWEEFNCHNRKVELFMSDRKYSSASAIISDRPFVSRGTRAQWHVCADSDDMRSRIISCGKSVYFHKILLPLSINYFNF